MRNLLHIHCELSETSLAWAIANFHNRADSFTLEVHPSDLNAASALALQFRLSAVEPNPHLIPGEWYVKATVAWGSTPPHPHFPGVPHENQV